MIGLYNGRDLGMSYDDARKAGLTVAQAIALSTGESLFEYPSGTGRYGNKKILGHHVFIKCAFRGNPMYNERDAFCLSEAYMKQYGIDHNDKQNLPSVSGMHKDYKGPNNMSMDSYFESNPVLLYIGKKLVEDALDKTNESFISEVTNPSTDIIRKKLKCFSVEQLDVLQEVIPWITFGTFSNMMWMFEQNEEIQLIVDYKGEKINIAEISDGCEGDMEGWIERFGRFRDFVSIEEEKQFMQKYGDSLNSFNE